MEHPDLDDKLSDVEQAASIDHHGQHDGLENSYHSPSPNKPPVLYAPKELIFVVERPNGSQSEESTEDQVEIEYEPYDTETDFDASPSLGISDGITAKTLIAALPDGFDLLCAEVRASVEPIPAVHLPTERGREYLFFRVRSSDFADDSELQIAIDFFDRYTSKGGLTLTGGLGTVKQVLPNWYNASSSHVTIGPHGPGCPPRPVPKNMVNGLKFVLSKTLQGAKTSPKDKVIVYILDTLPEPNRIKTALGASPDLAQYFKNILPAEGVAFNGINNEYRTNKASYIYTPTVPNISTANGDILAPGDHEYDSSDHGLFIAGIVHSIAPHAQIYVIQVMGLAGVGTIFDFADGFSKAAQIHRVRHSRAHAVVNCSFTLSIPIDGHDDSAPARSRGTYISQHDKFKEQIEYFTKAFNEALALQAIIVAAAGNDSKNPPPASQVNTSASQTAVSASTETEIDVGSAKETRYPAQFLDIIGVGALNRDRNTLAGYSNKADQPRIQGIYAFGGDYDYKKKRLAANIESGLKIEQGIIGIFTGNARDLIPGKRDEVAFSDQAKGYAEWAGTSFAAPIVSACIALLWSAHSGPKDAALAKIDAECELVTRVASSEQTRKLISVYQVHS